MSFRNLTPLAHTVLDVGQSGMLMVLTDAQPGSVYTGHADGSSGAATQAYVELLAGSECQGNTSADNTTGTYFFPEIKFFHSMANYGRDTNTGNLVDSFVQGKTSKYDNLSRTGSYDPATVTPSDYILLTNSDTVFGTFTRIAVSKPHASATDQHRIIVTKGV
tara:strand:+ start:916 stop:1404 length:489 start_codon:yes stop_codon:yes gene_type:complete